MPRMRVGPWFGFLCAFASLREIRLFRNDTIPRDFTLPSFSLHEPPACWAPMKTKDYLIVVLAPLPVLMIALGGNLYVEGWNWNPGSFVFAWVVIAGATFLYRLLATRKLANLSYRLGAGLAILAGFLVFWCTAAVQIIGAENPANVLYLGVILTGLAGVALSRLRPAGLAKAAFATALATFLVPVIAFLFWPADFSPGVPQVFALNSGFVLMFTVSGLLFRHAAQHRAQVVQ